MAVANMWHLSPGQDITLWKKELDHTGKDFQTPTLTLKRKAEHFDEMVSICLGRSGNACI